MRTAAVVASLALVAIACSRTKPAGTPTPAAGNPAGTPTPAAGNPAVAAAPEGPRPGGPPGPEGAGGAPRRRVPPNPFQQDTVRRAMVDSIMASIAGREMQPAGTVFKNVKLLRDMPAGDFVRTMESQYSRGLGWTCNNCHVAGKFDDDTRKNKRIARQMQTMQDYVNGTAFAQIKELDAEYDKATCAMCHKGSSEPKGEAPPVPTALRSGN